MRAATNQDLLNFNADSTLARTNNLYQDSRLSKYKDIYNDMKVPNMVNRMHLESKNKEYKNKLYEQHKDYLINSKKNVVHESLNDLKQNLPVDEWFNKYQNYEGNLVEYSHSNPEYKEYWVNTNNNDANDNNRNSNYNSYIKTLAEHKIDVKNNYNSDLISILNKKEIAKLWRLRNGVDAVEFDRYFQLLSDNNINEYSGLDDLLNINKYELDNFTNDKIQFNNSSTKKLLIYTITELNEYKNKTNKYNYSNICNIMMQLGYYTTPNCIEKHKTLSNLYIRDIPELVKMSAHINRRDVYHSLNERYNKITIMDNVLKDKEGIIPEFWKYNAKDVSNAMNDSTDITSYKSYWNKLYNPKSDKTENKNKYKNNNTNTDFSIKTFSTEEVDEYMNENKLDKIDELELFFYEKMQKDGYYKHFLNQLIEDNSRGVNYRHNKSQIATEENYDISTAQVYNETNTSIYNNSKDKFNKVKVRNDIDLSLKEWHGYDRRKEATATVTIKPGVGFVRVNEGWRFTEYFPEKKLRDQILSPLMVTNTLCEFDVDIIVKKGGRSGQAQAARKAIAKALVSLNFEFKEVLDELGYLQYDGRQRESKKFGKFRARKGHTYKRR